MSIIDTNNLEYVLEKIKDRTLTLDGLQEYLGWKLWDKADKERQDVLVDNYYAYRTRPGANTPPLWIEQLVFDTSLPLPTSPGAITIVFEPINPDGTINTDVDQYFIASNSSGTMVTVGHAPHDGSSQTIDEVIADSNGWTGVDSFDLPTIDGIRWHYSEATGAGAAMNTWADYFLVKGWNQINVEDKANKIVQLEQQPTSLYDYLNGERPNTLELPAGTEHTFELTEDDMNEVLSKAGTPMPGRNVRLRWSSVSGDFYIEISVVSGRRQDYTRNLKVYQKNVDGSFGSTLIWEHSVDNGHRFFNQTVAQIDWLQFNNYDMTWLIENFSVDVDSARTLNLWKHVTRSLLVQSTKDLRDVRDDMLGELTAATNTFNNMTVNGIQKIQNNIQVQVVADQGLVDRLIAEPDTASEGILYIVENADGSRSLYTKTGTTFGLVSAFVPPLITTNDEYDALPEGTVFEEGR